MSVGLLFAMAAQNGGDPAMFGMAVALAIGIGIDVYKRQLQAC